MNLPDLEEVPRLGGGSRLVMQQLEIWGQPDLAGGAD